jgi:6-pyruvoyltetrahydropterin/6-carboxytetrahydropterin synthase
MFAIEKTFHFSASHQLTSLPSDHQCARLHGHNYQVKIRLEAEEINGFGFVVDYGELDPFKKLIDTKLDHRHLNEVLLFEPTAELLARWLFRQAVAWWPQTASVAVSETPNTWAEYKER